MTSERRIDECLSVAGGRLRVERCDVAELAARFGTPLSVLSEDQLRRNARRFRAAFATAWPEGDVRVLPSIKANHSLAARRVLTDEGLGCDVFGPAELHAALACAVPPELISVNGTGKSEELIDRAVAVGARLTLDSAREIGLTRAAARRHGTRAAVRFRLRPRYDGMEQPSDFAPLPVRVVAQEYKPGIPTEDLLPAGAEALAAPELEVRGLMAHLGRHRADVETWRQYAASVAETVGELSAAWGGWRPAELDLGGGFASPRDPTARAGDGAERPDAPPIERVAEALAGGLRDGLAAAGIDARGIALEVEPGRGLYGDCGVHLAAVTSRKRQTQPVAWSWVETDTTEMFLADLLIEHARFPIVAATRMDEPDAGPADVVGCSCGFDVLGRQVVLPDVAAGDVLAFLDTGAYEDACASNFNALPRPALVLVRGDEAELVRHRETIEDVFSRDIVPERLLA